jgi:hypothetical protein
VKAADVELARLALSRGWITEERMERALLEADRCQALGLAKSVEEILVLTNALQLRPIVNVGYVREAYLGREQDSGLRLTIDSRIRGRDRDLDLREVTENRFIVQPHLSVVEVKVNERVPYWMTEDIARHNLNLRRISKYCQGVLAFNVVPRSAFHDGRTEL